MSYVVYLIRASQYLKGLSPMELVEVQRFVLVLENRIFGQDEITSGHDIIRTEAIPLEKAMQLNTGSKDRIFRESEAGRLVRVLNC
jgi:hypothetical protein